MVAILSYRVFDAYAEKHGSWYLRNKCAAESEVLVLERMCINKPALEVGVGSGFFSWRLNIEFGLDPSTRMLLIALRRGVECIRGAGENLPFRSTVFRTILLIATICFMKQPEQGLEEAYRALDSRGNIIVCMVPRGSCWGRFYKLKADEGHPIYRVAKFYSVREVITMLEECGFIVKQIVATLKGCPPAERIEDPATPSLKEAEKYGFVCVEAWKI